MSLPLERASGGADVTIPSSDSLSKLLPLLSSTRAADYARVCLQQLFKNAKMDTDPAAIAMLDEFAKVVEIAKHREVNLSKAWGGELLITPKTPLEHFHRNLSEEAFQKVAEDRITFDYAISDEKQFIRSYSSDGDVFDTDATNAMDVLFNAWLVTQNLLCKDGVIYNATKDGEIDTKATEISADTLIRLINDDKKGFAAFVKAQRPSTEIDLVQHDYPVEAAPQA